MRRRALRWMLVRMLKPIYEDRFYERIGRNPEDWDEIAYRMLRGLLGLPKRPPRYSDVGGRPVTYEEQP